MRNMSERLHCRGQWAGLVRGVRPERRLSRSPAHFRPFRSDETSSFLKILPGGAVPVTRRSEIVDLIGFLYVGAVRPRQIAGLGDQMLVTACLVPLLLTMMRHEPCMKEVHDGRE